MRPRYLSLLALALCAFAADDEGPRDLIITRTGPPIAAAEVVTEGADEVTFKVTAQAAPSKRRTREVVRIDYAGFREGNFKAGSDALAGGRFDEAAAKFHSAADDGKEWQKVYGSIAEGDALERAGKFKEAAAAFAVVAEGPTFEAHRLRLDAQYRRGFALALAKDPAADKVVATLVDLSKGKIGPPAETRASAIRTVQAAAKDANAKIDDLARRVVFRAEDGDISYHFSRWLIGALRTQGKAKEAGRAVEALLSATEKEAPAADNGRLVELRLLKGQILADSDPQAALVDLLKIDLLPFGTEDQRCEARLLAGKLLLAEAKALESNPETAKDEKKTAFVAEQRTTAKHLLSAVAASGSTKPAKAEAAKLAATLP